MNQRPTSISGGYLALLWGYLVVN